MRAFSANVIRNVVSGRFFSSPVAPSISAARASHPRFRLNC